MKPIKDILRSARFMHEVSLLLFFFAGLSALSGVLLLGRASSDADVLASAIGEIVQALIYAILGIMIRRGSIKALWIAGVLFVLDTLFILLHPSGTNERLRNFCCLGCAVTARWSIVGLIALILTT